MAQQTPPDYIPTWATDGGAVVTEPGAAKQAAGWLNDEVPSAGNMNSLMKENGGWTGFMQKLLAPHLGFGNILYTPDQPWGTLQLTKWHISYSSGLGKYYGAYQRAASNETICFETVDGVSFTTLTIPSGTGGSSRMVTDGANLVIIANESELYTSTTGSVTGLTSRGNGLPALRADWHLVYDAVNDFYVACDSFSNNTCIRLNNAVDDVSVPGDWANTPTLPATGSNVNGLAAGPHGRILQTRVNGTAWTTDAGATWSENLGVDNYSQPVWSPATNSFVAAGTATKQLHIWPEWSGFNGASVGLGIVVDGIMSHDDFLLVVGQPPSGTSNRRDAWAFRNAPGEASLEPNNLPAIMVGAWNVAEGVSQAYAFDNTGSDVGTIVSEDWFITECIDGAGDLIFPYNSGGVGSYRAITRIK